MFAALSGEKWISHLLGKHCNHYNRGEGCYNMVFQLYLKKKPSAALFFKKRGFIALLGGDSCCRKCWSQKYSLLPVSCWGLHREEKVGFPTYCKGRGQARGCISGCFVTLQLPNSLQINSEIINWNISWSPLSYGALSSSPVCCHLKYSQYSFN